MMKILVGLLGVMLLVAFGTLFGLIPVLIGLIVIAAFAVVQFMIFIFLTRGAPIEFMRARLHGGMVFAIFRRDRQVKFGRVQARGGMIPTKHHGTYNLMPGTIYSASGIPFAMAPEKVGYNIGIEHAQLAEELKGQGINEISEVADLDKYGRVLNFKDDPRLEKCKSIKLKPWTTGVDDFYKYTKEAADPIHQKVNIQLGIAQGLLGQTMAKWGWLVFAGLGVLFACLGIYLLLQYTGGGGKEPIEVIIDNTSHIITP